MAIDTAQKTATHVQTAYSQPEKGTAFALEVDGVKREGITPVQLMREVIGQKGNLSLGKGDQSCQVVYDRANNAIGRYNDMLDRTMAKAPALDQAATNKAVAGLRDALNDAEVLSYDFARKCDATNDPNYVEHEGVAEYGATTFLEHLETQLNLRDLFVAP